MIDTSFALPLPRLRFSRAPFALLLAGLTTSVSSSTLADPREQGASAPIASNAPPPDDTPIDSAKKVPAGDTDEKGDKGDESNGAPPAKRPENGYWSEGEPRFFISTKSDLGTPYLKPYFSAGYGLPHWIWAGVDVNSITTLEFTQIYGGVRASTPILDLAFGVRDTWSFGKPFLEPAQSFSRSDVLDAPGDKARYWAWEAEVVAIAPLPHSALVADFIANRTLDVPAGKYVYDESYRAVVAKPFFAIMRVAAVARLLNEDALKIGVLGEYVFENGRDSNVFRIGPAGALQITDHLEAQGTLTLCAYSPDNLGLTLGAYGVAGLRYRWATGERDPKLPWRGMVIP
jgi:hypothetical protein